MLIPPSTTTAAPTTTHCNSTRIFDSRKFGNVREVLFALYLGMKMLPKALG
jgi:hypothetical protein